MRSVLLLALLFALARTAPAENHFFGWSRQLAQMAHEKFLQEHPTSVPGHLAYAEFLSENGNLRAAVLQWRSAQRLAPENDAVANSLGGAYLRMGRAADSAEQFARAIELAGENAAYHFNLANVEFMLRHDLSAAWRVNEPDLLRRALAEFREASRFSPRDMEYARAYAESFYGMPDPDWSEAAAAWKHVLALSPQGDFAYLQLARISLHRNDATEARRCLDRIVDARHDVLKRKLQAQADQLDTQAGFLPRVAERPACRAPQFISISIESR
jgi:tetratricopeptide (TPR) repeat protein